MALRDIILVIIVNIAWGLNFIAVLFAVDGFPPLLANTIRFVSVVVFLLPFLKIIPGRMKDMMTIAFVMGVVHFGAIFIGMSKTEEVSTIAIVGQLSVPFATLMSVLMLGESVGWKRAAAIVLSFAGVIILGFDPKVFGYIDAVLWIVFSSFIYGVSTVLMRRLKDVRATTTQAWIAVGGIIGSLILSLLWESDHIRVIQAASLSAWGGVLYSAIGSSIIGHGGVNYLLRKYEVSVVAPYLLMTPFFAILGGIVFLGEALTWRVIVGGAMTLLGVLIVTLRNKARVEEELDAEGLNNETSHQVR
ncbi:DMT family transporter [Kordiimonas sp. SCSIO 12610]|uniref:DMT family transporter n=1 Tax=Kordiimonas sp. SCSIO 12610 TaxID=2829597 RepID=UPI00210A31E3|nr:DMT family transporter [Kordiimonas sp. SCSIO 12610]UTW56390.1 DMT family transporter [Kordiimonas sp. SCSIO 12610]